MGACRRGGKGPGACQHSMEIGGPVQVCVSGRSLAGRGRYRVPPGKAQARVFFSPLLCSFSARMTRPCERARTPPGYIICVMGAGFRTIIVFHRYCTFCVRPRSRVGEHEGSHKSYAVRYRGLCRIAGCRSHRSLPACLPARRPSWRPVTGTLTCQGSMREAFVAGGGASSSFSTTDPVQGSIGARPHRILDVWVGWLVGWWGWQREGESSRCVRVSRCERSADVLCARRTHQLPAGPFASHAVTESRAAACPPSNVQVLGVVLGDLLGSEDGAR